MRILLRSEIFGFRRGVLTVSPFVIPVLVACGKVWHLQLETNMYRTTLGRLQRLCQQPYDGATSAADIAARLKAATYAS